MFKKRVIEYQPIDIDRSELMTLAEASKVLNMGLPGVISAISRDILTEIIDEDANFHGRRLVLKSEVKKLALKKEEEERRKES
jgi:hypothetical protein